MRLWPWQTFRMITSARQIKDGAHVAIEGHAESSFVDLVDPLTGVRCVAIDYRAWPPDGALYGEGSTRFHARQYVDFILSFTNIHILVRNTSGEDVTKLHDRLSMRYGVQLSAQVDRITVGEHVRVKGRIIRIEHDTSPHRRTPWTAEIEAQNLTSLR